MSDPSLTEFSLSVSHTAETDEAFDRILADKTEPLRERAMLLISGLLASEEGPSLAAVRALSR